MSTKHTTLYTSTKTCQLKATAKNKTAKAKNKLKHKTHLPISLSLNAEQSEADIEQIVSGKNGKQKYRTQTQI